MGYKGRNLTSQLTEKANRSKNDMAWIGDSHTALLSSLPNETNNEWVYFTGFLHVANTRLNQRLNIASTLGISGSTSGQILASDIIDRTIEFLPSFCGVLAGTNDIANNVTVETIIENLKVIYNKLLVNNINVIATTIPPNNNLNTAQKQNRAKLNSLIKKYAFETKNVYLYDMASFVSAEDGDTYLTGCSTDSIHLTDKGGQLAGTGLAKMLEPLIVPYNNFVCSNNDPSNLLPNALFTSGTTLATGWAEWPVNSVTPIVSRNDGQVGKWQQVTMGSEDIYFQVDVTTGYSIGDKIKAAIEFELDDVSTGVNKISFFINCTTPERKAICNYFAIAEAHGGVLQTPEIIIPTGTTKLTLYVITSGASGGRVRYGRPKLEIVE